MKPMQFLRDWSLPIAMSGGASAYLLYRELPLPEGTGNLVSAAVSFLQPTLIFAMLFVTFCKVKVKELLRKTVLIYLTLRQNLKINLLNLIT